MDSKDFPENWLISPFYFIFKSKIILSEVRLRRKVAFQSTCHKIWNYEQKKLFFFKSESPIFKIYLKEKCLRTFFAPFLDD
jgi:hypothetical protein